MTEYPGTNWLDHCEAWSHPPVDDVGYISSHKMLNYSDQKLRELVDRLGATRFGGWRNHGDLWRRLLKFDQTTDKTVLDYGCGVGVEALELARSGNYVQIADISVKNLALATRVLRLYGYEPALVHLVQPDPPFIDLAWHSVDVVHCSGVLHHIVNPKQVMARFHQLLKADGEVRLMLYSDHGWCQGSGQPLPAIDAPIHLQPGYSDFVRHFDQVGTYADWYNEDKLRAWFGEWFQVQACDYVTANKQYLIATLTPK